MKQTVFAVITGSLFISRGDLMFPTALGKGYKRTRPGSCLRLSKEKLIDKIKGGWCRTEPQASTYGGPTEFRYSGTMIQECVPIVWPDGYIKSSYENVPGLYDDVYHGPYVPWMSLTGSDLTLLWTHSPWRSLRRDIYVVAC